MKVSKRMRFAFANAIASARGREEESDKLKLSITVCSAQNCTPIGKKSRAGEAIYACEGNRESTIRERSLREH